MRGHPMVTALAATLLGLAPVITAPARAETPAGSATHRFQSWHHHGVEDGLPSDTVFAVAVDGDRVWAGTEKGLAVLENGRLRVVDTGERLPFPAVTALAVSPGGDLWIGTMGGLACLSGGQMETFTQLDSGLANDVVYGVAATESSVWVATAAGLNRYDPAGRFWEIYDTSNTLMHEPWCYAVATHGEDVYVAVWGGGVLVREANADAFRAHRDPDGEMEIDLFRDDGLVHDVTSAVSFSDGVLWVGTYFGLSRYENRRWQSYSQEDSGLVGDFINFVKARDGVVWIGTDEGLGRFDSHTWQGWRRQDEGGFEMDITSADGLTTTWPAAAGPASNTIYSIDLDGKDVWLATAAGLSHGVTAVPAPTAGQDKKPAVKGAPR